MCLEVALSLFSFLGGIKSIYKIKSYFSPNTVRDAAASLESAGSTFYYRGPQSLRIQTVFRDRYIDADVHYVYNCYISTLLSNLR